MKLCYFNDWRLGVIKGDQVVDVTDAAKGVPHRDTRDLIVGVIAEWDSYKGKLEKAAADGKGVPLAGVRLRPPVPRPGNIDCVFQDHEYIKRLGKYDHMWGIGRHLLGSQVYDYWCDPWGRVHERWADTDRLNASNGGHLLSAEEGFQSQWGERPPERFLGHASP